MWPHGIYMCVTYKCHCVIYIWPYNTYIDTVMSLLLTCCILYWCHIDVVTAACLNHHLRDACQPTLRHRGIVVIVTVTVRVW